MTTRSADAAPQPLLACSGCAGDYEDPEQTTRSQAGEDDEDEAGDPGTVRERFAGERFPAGEL